MYFETIRPEDIFRKQNNQRGILVDVRDCEAYQCGHIPGAINIPYEELRNRVPFLRERVSQMSDKSKPAVVIVYCDRGNTSLRAAIDLTRQGFWVKNVYGGIKNYHGPLTSD